MTDKPDDEKTSNVVPFPKTRELTTAHRKHLHESGLSDEQIERAGIFTEASPTRIAQMIGWSRWRQDRGGVIVFPYFLPGNDGQPVMYRIRPDRPRIARSKGKERVVKYEQPKNVPVAPFFPPNTREEGLVDPERPLVWTEGEKKSLLLDQLGYPTIGGTGVYCFHDTEFRDLEGKWQLHKLLRTHVKVSGRHHLIAFDSDAATNESVYAAARRLAGMLLAAGAGSVRFIRIPAERDETTGKDEKLGIDDYFVKFGEVATRALLRSGEEIDPLSPEDPFLPLLRCRAFRGADIKQSLRMPHGYEVERDGTLWRKESRDADGKLVARGAILIRQILIDLYSGEERVEVIFRREGRWKGAIVDRRTIADSRQVVAELAPLGAPVDTNCASEMVRWLGELEHVNERRFPRKVCVTRCGWHELEEEEVFLAPDVITNHADPSKIVFDMRERRSRTVSGLREKGELEAQLEILRKAWASDRIAATTIAGALAAPILRKLSAPAFAIHLVGDSSKGKSSMLKIAASLYGDPASEEWVQTWNSTSVGLEVRAGTLCDLPMCVDEAGVADPHQRERFVYMLIDGTGRTRGARGGGLRDTPSWRTVVLSTGERELVSDQAPTGAQVRVLQFHVHGFGDLDASGVDALRTGAEEHFGLVGRKWLRYLAELDDWDRIRAEMKEIVRGWRRDVGGSSVRSRQVTYFALLAYVESLAADALGLGDPEGGTIMEWFGEGVEEQRTVETLAERALDFARDWFFSSRNSFAELEKDINGATKPRDKGIREVFGYVGDHAIPEVQRPIYFLKTPLQRALEGAGMDWGAVKEWKRLGWLDTNEKSRVTKKIRVGGSLVRVVALKPEILRGNSGGLFEGDAEP